MVQAINPIVCDIGADSIKIGFSGSLTPEHIIPTIMAIPRQANAESLQVLKGSEALRTRYRTKFTYIRPIDEYGMVQNWEVLEALLERSLVALGVDPARSSCRKYKLLLTKAQTMKQSDFHKLLEMIFVNFRFGAITVHDRAALVLYTHGVETGLVVELGDTMTTIVPVYQGYAIPKLNQTMDVGGRSITQYLVKLLHGQGYHMNAREDLESVRELKERTCYVALDPTAEETLADETTILETKTRLHDGTKITVGKERFQAPELLFQPKLWDSEQSGLANQIFDTIQAAPIDCRVDLYQNIILSGGCSLLPGLRERVEHDLTKRYQADIGKDTNKARISCPFKQSSKLQVHAQETRQFAVYEGGALFADLIQNESQFWVTHEEYIHGGGMKKLLETCQI